MFSRLAPTTPPRKKWSENREPTREQLGQPGRAISANAGLLRATIEPPAKMPETKIGQFSDLLQLASEPLRPVMESVRALIFEIDPDACEVVRLGEKAASYGCGPRKMIDGYAYIMPFRRWVNLGFFQGASLTDPQGLLEGTGAKLRHIKLRTVEDTKKAGVRALVKEAYAERKAASR